MSLLATILLAEALASAPVAETPEPAVVDVVKEAPAEGAAPRTVRVTSDRSSYLRKDGVVMFEGHVAVDDVEFKMHADEVTLFLQGTNELKRVVAIGNVVVTNGLRNGSCAKATYNKALSKVVLYGDEKKGVVARLEDNGRRRSSVAGSKITFWIDSEQVEVEKSVVEVDAGGVGSKDGLRQVLGK